MNKALYSEGTDKQKICCENAEQIFSWVYNQGGSANQVMSQPDHMAEVDTSRTRDRARDPRGPSLD